MKQYSLNLKIGLFLFLVIATDLTACAPADGPVTPDSFRDAQGKASYNNEQPQIRPPAQRPTQPVPAVAASEAEPGQQTASPIATSNSNAVPIPTPSEGQEIPTPPIAPPIAPTVTYSAPTEAPVMRTKTTIQTAPPAQSQVPKTFEEELLGLINASRAQGNLPALRLSRAESRGVGQCAGSYGHSVHMQQVGQISHDQFPADICVPSPAEAENVGMSTGDEEYALRSIHQGMMDEGVNGGHYQNIMSPNYDSVGIGLYYRDGVLWLTEDFLQSSYSDGR